MYECVNCGHQIDVEAIETVPTCPSCNGPRMWQFRSDGQSNDEHPDD
jgi:DNA-directed RNA polymerase subunit RPC12/RpoP